MPVPGDKLGLYDREIPNLIRKLRRFLDEQALQGVLKQYRDAVAKAQAQHQEIYAAYYLQDQHPWWEALIEYNELERCGKSIRREASPRLVHTAGDAHKLVQLQRTMPPTVQEHYRRVLLDTARARDYLFELNVAWHYHSHGYSIRWSEDTGGPQPEFSIRREGHTINVECKKSAIDSYRRIKRDQFALMLDMLMPLLNARSLAGTVELEFDDRLPSNRTQQQAVASAIVTAVKEGKTQVMFEGGEARVQLKLSTRPLLTRRELEQAWNQLQQDKPVGAYAYLSAPFRETGFTEPITILCQSRRMDRVLRGIRNRLSEASRKQFNSAQPGMLAYFIPEIEDFSLLRNEGGLKVLTDDLFRSEQRQHVVAISFLSDYHATETPFGQHVSAPMLTFFNGNSLFPDVRALLESSTETVS